MRPNNKRLNIMALIILTVIVVLIASISIFYGHNKRIPLNPEDTIGSTAGNLNNMGYFCESDGVIYFANSYDNYHLYALDPATFSARLINDVPVSYINVAGDYLYYYYNDVGDAKFMGVAGNMRGVYRIKKNGKDSQICLDRTTSGIVSLFGNKLYYQHYDNAEGMTLYSVSTDGKEKEQISKSIINPSCIMNGDIYYPDTENMFYLNILDVDNGSSSYYLPERMYNPTPSGDFIYYMNVNDNYTLYRYDYYAHTTQKLTNERVDVFNVYGNNVFYQTNSSTPYLARMMGDGSNPTIIAEGIYTDINCTSTYTFFRPFESEDTFYMIQTEGGTQYSTFNPILED